MFNRINCRILLFVVIVSFACYFPVNARERHYRPPQAKAGHDFTKIAPDAEYSPDHVLILFEPKSTGKIRTKAERGQLLQTVSNATVERDYANVPGLSRVKLAPGQTVQQALELFNRTSGIAYAEPDYKIYLTATFPDDEYISNDPQDPNNLLWGLHNIGQTGGKVDGDIDAPEAWDIATSSDILVAVLDTGVDYNHPDLVDNLWTNQLEVNGDPNVDDDGNGYVDDIYGWDFADDDADPLDYYQHGTHVAGTIGAVGDNGIGVVGVCWNVKIMTVKIFPNYLDDTFISKAVEAIEYSVDMGAKVLNNSWGGGPYSAALEAAIMDANDAGVIFVASAGNSAYPSAAYPARFDIDNIISVLATDHNDQIAWFSNYNSVNVDLGAPGVGILSCLPNDQYGYGNGTSMAAPHVTGACALAWSEHPNWTHLELKQAILDSVDKLTSLNGLCATNGRLNLYKTLTYKPPLMTLSIDDNIDPNQTCGVVPYDEVTYEIAYAPDEDDHANVEVTVFLPPEVYFVSADPNDGAYDWYDHTYTWFIGDVDGGDPNQFLEITVQVNELAEPLGEIIVEAMVESDTSRTYATDTTPVCCWGGDRIYVKADSSGFSGTSWAMAYRDLKTALERAEKGCGTEIWVAQGVYLAGTSASDSLQIPDGVELYGGFAGNETTINERDFVHHRTYLSGNDECTNVLKFINVGDPNVTILDGFIIGNAKNAGIYCDNTGSYAQITNCVLIDNNQDGLYCRYSDLKIADCVFKNNADDGIDCYGIGYAPLIENCVIDDNSGDGIFCNRTAPTILNSFIHRNGQCGINLYYPSGQAEIRNVTITNNTAEAIKQVSGTAAAISNAILWHNDSENGFNQLSGCTAEYSCITNPADPNGLATGAEYPDQYGNVSCDPNFAYKDPDCVNFHLHPLSYCIDLADETLVGQDELDLDGDDRITVADPCVAMGADEVACVEDVTHELDFNGDGLINLVEFSALAKAWFSIEPGYTQDPNESENWNGVFDFDVDHEIDAADLAAFAEEWLWMACWKRLDIWTSTAVTMAEVPEGGTQSLWLSPETLAQLKENWWRIHRPDYEPTLFEQIVRLYDMIIWLEDIWDTDPKLRENIDPQDWQEFMAELYDMLDELEALYYGQT